ncbi:MAG: 3-oxoadipate enol-lactonase [Paracoccaceae bacterium]
MRVARVNNVALHWREDDDPAGRPVVFANSLGTDLRLWDKVIPLLPRGLRLIRFDKRGHGLSACPAAPYDMEALIDDAEALLDHLGVRDCLFVGLSIGGMIAQGLAARRPDLVRAVVLSNSAARMGTAEMWADRIAAIEAGGIEVLAEPILERWFAPAFRETDELEAWRNMLVRTPKAGYLGCCHALAGADLTERTRALRQPLLAIAGSDDGASPPEVVRATADLVAGARFEEIAGAGHLPCVEAPGRYAEILNAFIEEVGHD